MTSNEIRTSPPETSGMEGHWRKTVEFMNRDLRSFLPSGKKQTGKVPEEAGPTPADTEQIKSLVDPGNVEYLAFRREVLDWRDNFHTHVTLTSFSLYEEFVQWIDKKLDEVGFIRQIITKPASEVLQGQFIRAVRVPLYSSLIREEEKRAAMSDVLGSRWQFNFRFKMQWPDSECDCLRDIGFKRANRKAIHSKIEALVLGENGVAAGYREQATHIARRLIEEKQAC